MITHRYVVILSLLCKALIAAPMLTQLSVSDGQFVDTANRLTILHGVNVVNKQSPYTPAGAHFNQRHMRLLTRYGFTVVRLGIYWQAIEPKPGDYQLDYLASIKKTIQQLSEHRIYTLLDFHQDAYAAIHGGLGAPAWAALATTTAKQTHGFPLNYFLPKPPNNAIAQDFDAFWQNKKGANNISVQESYLQMMGVVMRYFKGNNNVLGYDVMNEPFAGSAWVTCGNKGDFTKGCQQFDATLLTAFYRRTAKLLSRIDEQKILFYEPTGLSGLGAKSYLGKISYPQLAFSFHNYYPQNWQMVLDDALVQKSRYGAVPFMGEFDANATTDGKLKQLLALADQLQLSWTQWAYFNNPIYHFDTTELPTDPRKQGLVLDLKKPLTGKNVNWQKINLLSRPYPLRIAGRDLHYRYANNTFSVNFTSYDSHGKALTKKPDSIFFIPQRLQENIIHWQVKGAKLLPIEAAKHYWVLRNNDAVHHVSLTITFRHEKITQK